jgi:predicted alpha-1,2-mannosidase
MKNQKRYAVITAVFLSMVHAQGIAGPRSGRDWVGFVNPLIGTLSDFEFSNGNTYPAIALPRGMNFWTPQTGRNGDGWQYTYQAKKIVGFKQTHQPSPWINDYGCFSIMPARGACGFRETERSSWFSHKTEKAAPHYYRVYLADPDATVEITPTERAARFRITFHGSGDAAVVLDAFPKGSSVKIIPEERKITGFSRYNSGGVPSNFHNFFVILFDAGFESGSVWSDSTLLDALEAQGEHVGAVVRFKALPGGTVGIRAASSFISPEQAELNLAREIGDDSFEQTESKAREIWNRELGKIAVEGGTEGQFVTFYTALYRALLFPREFHELDPEGRIVHYSPFSGKVLPGVLFTDNGFWDTFRAAFPLTTILSPSVNSLVMQGLVNTYLESGWLPEWASPGHRDCMIGSNSASIIADSYLKGIRGYGIDILYEALIKNSNHEGPLSSVGRAGVKFYNSLGYIPYDSGIRENTARTLEYSYDDFTLMKLAEALGRPQAEVDLFAARARHYRNVFNPASRFMQGRNADGTWQAPFVPEKWGDAFTEGCSWHYTWCVFHDILGLQDMMGGKEAFASKLDSLFTAPPLFDFSYYGFQIHEITEMAVAGMGQYAHGNQPVQHGAYLFNYCGRPWKTQYWVRQIMDRLYTPLPDGLCGDEDNGQTSAWYVFSAMGFYPVCPGTGEYVFGSPLFRKVTLELENGNRFIIEAPGNSAETPYVRELALNGVKISRNFIRHEDILDGGRLVFIMDSRPDTARGTGEEDAPYSMSRESR